MNGWGKKRASFAFRGGFKSRDVVVRGEEAFARCCWWYTTKGGGGEEAEALNQNQVRGRELAFLPPGGEEGKYKIRPKLFFSRREKEGRRI